MMKVFAGVGLGVVALAGCGFGYLVHMKPSMRPASDEKVDATPERIARGDYLVNAVIGCTGCHSEFDSEVISMPPKAGTLGQGGFCFDKADAGFPGKVCAQNITSDRETGIGAWTDGEIMRAFREGVDRDGNALMPMMPYGDLRNLSDEDARSVVAYVRTLPPISRKNPKGHLDFPVNLAIKFAPKPLTGPVPEPDHKDTVAYGKYLANLSCVDCHTPVDSHMNRLTDQLFAGGRDFDMSGAFPGLRERSANLTPDDTGIKAMSRQNFISAFAAYRDPAVRAEKVSTDKNTLMPWITYSHLTDEDLGAIYDYLRTLPPIHNPVERRPPPAHPATAT